MFRSHRIAGLAIVPAAMALVLIWQASEPPGGAPLLAQPGPLPPSPSSRLLLSHTFYGSTPSLSWSPDGRRLAFNAAYDYFGHDSALAAHASQLGLWVYERDGATVRQLVSEQRYHPAWLGDDSLVSGCSPYEDCTEGMYVADLSGHERRTSVGDGVYHTLAGTDGQVLFYNGFRGSTRWNRFDVTTEHRETGVSANCSWEPPPELFIDQCVQSVGDVSVAVDLASGLWVRYGEGAAYQVDTLPPFEYSSSAWDCSEDHSGPVAPCLSPDAGQVAYVARGPDGLLLRVHELPTAAEVASGPSPTSVAPTTVPPASLFGAPAGASPGVDLSTTPEPLPLQVAATQAVGHEPSRSYLAFDFYGDTATLAWSADGRRLAFNAAFQSSAYRGDWDTAYNGVLSQLGLYVADVSDGSVRRVVAQQRYHPSWIGDETLASACSSAEDCATGLALTDLAGDTSLVVRGEVPSTAASNDGQLLFYDASLGVWSRFDTASRGTTEVANSCLWEPPEQFITDQCVQRVGDVRVWAEAGTGLWIQVGSASPIRLDPSAAWIYEGYAWACTRDDFSGPVQPCLSPDGRYVAYVTRSLFGLSLHLHDVPR